MAQRVKPEADVGRGRRDAIPLDHGRQLPRDVGRIHPGLQVDRTGMALRGVILGLATEALTLDDVGANIDMPTLVLLFALST